MKMRVILEKAQIRCEFDVNGKTKHLFPMEMENNYKNKLSSGEYWNIVGRFFNLIVSPGGNFDFVKPDFIEIDSDVGLHEDYFI